MLRILTRSIIFTLLVLFPILPVFAQTSDQAREQLDELRLSYSSDTFVESVKRDDFRAVQLFLAAGMSPNVRDRAGSTPLIHAAEDGNTLIAQTLLQNGADINATEAGTGMTALHYAIDRKYPETVMALLRYGADPNVRNAKGMTPLMLAAQKGEINIVRALLQYGADIYAQANNGWTAILFASERGYNNIAIELQTWANALEAEQRRSPPVVSGRAVRRHHVPISVLLKRAEMER